MRSKTRTRHREIFGVKPELSLHRFLHNTDRIDHLIPFLLFYTLTSQNQNNDTHHRPLSTTLQHRAM